MYSQLRLVMPDTVCNLACQYCLSGYNNHTSCSEAADFAAEQILKTINGRAFESISIWGGEPLANFEKLQQTVAFCRRYYPDIPIRIITNGYLMNEEKADYLNANNIAITISHDGYAQYYRNQRDFLLEHDYLNLLKRIKNDVSFNSVVHRFNCNIPSMFHYFEKAQDKIGKAIGWNFELFKLHDAKFAKFIIAGKAIDELAKSFDFLFEQFEKGHPFAYTSQANRLNSLARLIDEGKGTLCQCGANRRLSIRTDGKPAFCQVAAELGNYSNAQPDIPPMCSDCEYAKYCTGICPLMSDGYRKKLCISYKLYYFKTFQFFHSLRERGEFN
ncbi:MAG: hypothetical protein H6Q72_1911 [Firmicutes bacterium]|nr:hypothetical protein [Bacillota bacterium]